MNFKQLIRLYENEIVFQHPGTDEEKNRDKILKLQQFEKWFKKNEFKLIWNEQAQGYDSNTNINMFHLDLKLNIIPIQFNIIRGNFDCSYNQFKSLEGSPKEVEGYFNCSNNKLILLKGSLKEVEKDFDCSFNNLKSLEGCPEKIGRDFYCEYNNLTSLKGCLKIIKGNFDCSHNNLKSLKECPKEIKGNFNCIFNKLISLEGSPEKVGGNFYCSNNKVKFTEEEVRSRCNVRGKIIT